MDALNYHHLQYFWVVAREGGVTRASEVLHVSQPTISTQLKQLERSVGAPLFRREGRNLVLTERGHLVFRYADEIFAVGRDLQRALQLQSTDRPVPFRLGLVDAVPKSIAAHLLLPVMRQPSPVPVICLEEHADKLLAMLALHQLDLVLSDSPIGSMTELRAYDHHLGGSQVSFYGLPDEVAMLAPGFPHSLQGAQVILPTSGTGIRRSLDQWLDERHLQPVVVAEIADLALITEMALEGAGLFVAPQAIQASLNRLGFSELAPVSGIQQRYYAITAARKVKHPAGASLIQDAKTRLESGAS